MVFEQEGLPRKTYQVFFCQEKLAVHSDENILLRACFPDKFSL